MLSVILLNVNINIDSYIIFDSYINIAIYKIKKIHKKKKREKDSSILNDLQIVWNVWDIT